MPSRPFSLNSVTRRSFASSSFEAFIVYAFLNLSHAGGLVGPGDEALRHDLQYLSDRVALDLSLTTWPLSSEAINDALKAIDPAALDANSRASYQRLKRYASNTNHGTIGAYAGTDRTELRSFSSDYRESSGVHGTYSASSSHSNALLSLAAIDSPIDGRNLRLDGSYIEGVLGNWALGAGSIDRWWGPGWQNSLILSHNARPSPGLFVRRVHPRASELPILKHLGPWSFEAFANQLESARAVPEAKLLGTRFAFKPYHSLEIELSRTAQWGGEGRPETMGTLFDLLIGNDNRGDSGIADDASNEPGNQLGGIDWRYAFEAWDQSIAIYGQFIGEDEAGGLPSREIGMLGLETSVTSERFHGRIFLEFADTTMRFLDNGIPNSTYNHSIYKSGYRYYGLPIGASSDNDSRTLILGGYLGLPKDNSITWRAGRATLNWDSIQAGNRLAPNRVDTYLAQFDYRTPISENTRLIFSGSLSTEPLGSGPLQIRKGIRSGIDYQF